LAIREATGTNTAQHRAHFLTILYMRIPRRRYLFFLSVLSANCLSGCNSQKTQANLSYEDALAEVRQKIPAESYFSNEFLKKAAAEKPQVPASPDKVRIGMPWILNDECALWYVAVEKGYFRDVGIDAELVPGGPGKDQLTLLAAGSLEVAVTAAGGYVISLVASPTGAKVTAICALLKDSPYDWITLDKSIPSDRPSALQLKPEDVIGKTVGIQPDGEPYARFLLQKYHLPVDKVKLVRAGFTADPLASGAVDFYSAWVQNQPRFLEQDGHKNWTGLRFKDFGWNEHCDVSVVKKSLAEQNPGLVTRYVYALSQAIQFVLDHPEETADIAVRYGKDSTLSRDLVLRRFQLERDLVLGHDGQPPLWMSADVWNNSAALFTQYGVINLE
jgi:NitT/TauT family transport system substrate-binding protein